LNCKYICSISTCLLFVSV